MSDASSSHITHWLSTVPSPETITSVGQPPCKQSRSQKRKATSLEDDNLEDMASSDMRPPVTPERKKRRLEVLAHAAFQCRAFADLTIAWCVAIICSIRSWRLEYYLSSHRVRLSQFHTNRQYKKRPRCSRA